MLSLISLNLQFMLNCFVEQKRNNYQFNSSNETESVLIPCSKTQTSVLKGPAMRKYVSSADNCIC